MYSEPSAHPVAAPVKLSAVRQGVQITAVLTCGLHRDSLLLSFRFPDKRRPSKNLYGANIQGGKVLVCSWPAKVAYSAFRRLTGPGEQFIALSQLCPDDRLVSLVLGLTEMADGAFLK